MINESVMPTWVPEFNHTNKNRSLAWKNFINLGLPTLKYEAWKYSNPNIFHEITFSNNLAENIDLAPYTIENALNLVFIDGQLHTNSQISNLSGIEIDFISHLDDAIFNQIESCLGNMPFANLVLAHYSKAVKISLTEELDPKLPINFIFLQTGKVNIINTLNLLDVSENCRANLIYSYVGSQVKYFHNQLNFINLAKSANLSISTLQNESLVALHLNHILIKQDQDSEINLHNFSRGAAWSRTEIIAHLLEKSARCNCYGFYNLNFSDQLTDYHLELQHKAPNSSSQMLYKGIIGSKSRVIFNGKLLIEKGAQKISAYQANHNLLLSKDAEAYSKPELEIYADDVKCKHGATTGQIDKEILFYLRARGIPYTEAIKIMLAAFAEEVIDSIANETIRSHIAGAVL